VVDDESSVRQLLADHLSGRPTPYEVLTASDGFEAGRLVVSSRPDVVLLDLRMPGLDGFQICRTIKADPETANTVVIAMTGFYSVETETRILECGAIRCFAKPLDAAVLSSFIDSVFDKPTGRPKSRRRRPATIS
jgi:DNA-binding response OmpR family regulator